MPHIFIIGGTTFDHIISLPEFPEPIPQTIHQAGFNEATGSTGAGKALCLKKLGVSNSLYSVLGNDSYGHRIIDHLERETVDFVYDFDPQGTERHVNLMDAQGGRISIFVTQSSENLDFNFARIEEHIQKSDVVVLNILSYCKQLVPIVEKYKKSVWTDLHDYSENNPYHVPFIEAADYIFLSSDNLIDFRSAMKGLIGMGKELVVCTHGKEGATALTKDGHWFEEPALCNFSLIDANGAGDNFFSGFLYGFLKNEPIANCLKYGTLCGAYCITSPQLVFENLSADLLEDGFLKYYR
ncbi:MAG: carbohydrate kinase family protein [Salinivirgaceae bacterium]|nr:carbohydrate kinase family protein [Salinivirgaceae bacterium]